jgi:CubicO group peptidase (beta-lactamase class C family)
MTASVRPARRRLTPFAVLFAVLLLSAPTSMVSAQDAPSPAGRWEGAIETPGTPLGVIVDLSRTADGSWQGDVDIPLQGAKDLPLTAVAVDGAAVRFTISGIPGEPTFAGTLSGDAATLAGDFTQGGATFPFSLSRAGEAAVAERLTAEQALAGFDAWMAGQLAAWKVPGASVAVVRGGEVVLTKGYGLRDVEDGLPVTAGTLFAIGSATKAFTATVLATLVDEGELEWDEPVRRYLPDFTLYEETYSARVTPRDLLSHRTGLPRHDLVWYGSPLSREELYRRLRWLEPTEDLRAAWQYQNLMFMTAGYLAGQLAGSEWETLVEERLFAPLGMEDSNFSVGAMAATADHATPYEKTDEDDDGVDEIEPMPFRRIDAVGPAGSINSNARDMAQWTRLQLGLGTVDGEEIVGRSALAPLHQPLMVVPGGLFSALFKQPEMPYLMYGMGWFVQPYRGHEMVHHGGNIDGFSARVTFLPNDDLGIVVLTNLDGTSLPTVVTLDLIDRFLGAEPTDWSGRYLALTKQLEGAQEQAEAVEEVGRRKGTQPSHPLAEYAGTYAHPAYGEIEVTTTGDALHLAYHTLESPLEHWHYDVFRASDEELEGAKLAFEAGLSGHVERLVMDLQPGAAAIEFDKQPAAELADPARLAEYAGAYELMGLTLTVGVRETEEGGGELTLAVPGQGTSVLAPVREDEFEITDQEGYGLIFERGDDGSISRMILVQPQGNMPAAKKPEGEAAKEAA